MSIEKSLFPEREMSNSLMRCKVCGGPTFPDLHREGGWEELRYRCIKDCRGSELSQVRKIPFGVPEREVRKEDFAEFSNRGYNTKRPQPVSREFECGVCHEKVSGTFYRNRKVCKKCETENRRLLDVRGSRIKKIKKAAQSEVPLYA